MSHRLLAMLILALTSLIWSTGNLVAGPAVILNAGVVQDSGGLSDEAIDRAGDQAMNGHEFRSVRRQVLEKVVVEDVDKGFLKETLKSIGEGIRSVFDAIGDFFRWLFGGSGRTKQAAPPAPAPYVPSGSSGDWGFSLPDWPGSEPS